jgi:hypothetical protein
MDGSHTAAQQVLPGEYRDHARHRLSFRRVHATQLGMRIVRTRESGMKLAGQIDVIGIPARAGDEPPVLAPENRLRDTKLGD